LLFPASPWAAPSAETAAARRMAVLDLVDLQDNQVKSEPSEWLRRSLITAGKFKVLPRDSMVKKLAEFNVSPNQPCNNPQCGFDAGNYLQTDFILFGTYSSLPGIDAVTLKLIYVPKAVIAWTWVGELQAADAEIDRAGKWEKLFTELAKIVGEAPLVLEKPETRRTLAVVDLSDLSYQSRVFSERVLTRVNSFPQFDLLGAAELSELFTALEINKYSVTPSLENMLGLGQKLGVSNLIYSRVYRDGKSYLCRLSMYDVEGRSAVLEMPPKPTEDFNRLLQYEREFFADFAKKEKERAKAPVAVKKKGKSRKALWISLGVLGVGGGLTAMWVDNLKNGGSGTPDFPDPLGPPSNPDL
jgi:hypothetical protein